MKIILLSKYTEEDVRKYWKRIGAPVFLRNICSSPNTYSVGLRPGYHPVTGNIFLFDSMQMSDLNHDAQVKSYVKVLARGDDKVAKQIMHEVHRWEPKEVIEGLHGKML